MATLSAPASRMPSSDEFPMDEDTIMDDGPRNDGMMLDSIGSTLSPVPTLDAALSVSWGSASGESRSMDSLPDGPHVSVDSSFNMRMAALVRSASTCISAADRARFERFMGLLIVALANLTTAMMNGVLPRPTDKVSTGGGYFMEDMFQHCLGMYKPEDEEPYAINNPKGYGPGAAGSPAKGIKAGVHPGEGASREVAAFILDRNGFSGVPPTVFARAWHRSFSGIAPTAAGAPHLDKLGSLQLYVPHLCSAEDVSYSLFPVDQVHKIGILDIRICNLDRNMDNILVCAKFPVDDAVGRSCDPAVLMEDYLRSSAATAAATAAVNRGAGAAARRGSVSDSSEQARPPMEGDLDGDEEYNTLDTTGDADHRHSFNEMRFLSVASITKSTPSTPAREVVPPAKLVHPLPAPIPITRNITHPTRGEAPRPAPHITVDDSANSRQVWGLCTPPRSGCHLSRTARASDSDSFDPSVLRQATSVQLVPIDHGLCLPRYNESLGEVESAWLFWRQAREPFSAATLEYISSLDAEADITLLHQVLGSRVCPEAAMTLRFTTALLKIGAADGLNLSEIGSMLQRDLDGVTSPFERLIRDAVMTATGKAHPELTADAIAAIMAEFERALRPVLAEKLAERQPMQWQRYRSSTL